MVQAALETAFSKPSSNTVPQARERLRAQEQPEQGTNSSCGWGWSRTLWTWRP
jgi:hypothetical protein